MLLRHISRDQIRDGARRELENLEQWLRRWIESRLTDAFGLAYWDAEHAGNRVIPKRIVDALRTRTANEPDRYPREVDAIHLADAFSIITHPQCFRQFQQPLRKMFPQASAMTIKALLDTIVPARHKLYHANELSYGETMRLLSYAHDLVSVIKRDFESRNQAMEYNVPSIVRVSDSLGNAWYQGQGTYPVNTVHPNDSIIFDVEVDPTFPTDSYSIQWWVGGVSGAPHAMGARFTHTFGVANVQERFLIWCRVVQNKEWHRHGNYDDMIKMEFKVLPPEIQ